MSQFNLRAMAATTLTPLFTQGQSLSGRLEPALERVEGRDRSLLQELCLGTLRQYHSLNQLIAALLDKPLRSKDIDIHLLIALGLYQLRFMRVPDHAAISETVNACRTLKKNWASKLVNGVLRRYLREKSALEQQAAQSSEYIFSHPRWLIDAIQHAWPEQAKEILIANNTKPPLCLRINQQRCDRAHYLQRLSAVKIDAKALTHAPAGIMLEQAVDIRQLPGFEQGLFSVQDEAAQLAAELLNLAAGYTVLDACSAPGGKSCHILEHNTSIDRLTCVEQDAGRMQRVEQNLTRLKLAARAKLHIADVGNPQDWWDGKPFDRILLDVPCSATGVIRRHPDIKLLRRATDIEQLATVQLKLLRAVWPTLAPGGQLLYATCSVLPQENECIVEQFLAEQHDAVHSVIDANWGIQRKFGRQLFPQTLGHDGFYYARIEKTGN